MSPPLAGEEEFEGEKDMKGIVSLIFLRRQSMRGFGILCDVLPAWLVVSLAEVHPDPSVYMRSVGLVVVYQHKCG
jgi:hypothetical protein